MRNQIGIGEVPSIKIHKECRIPKLLLDAGQWVIIAKMLRDADIDIDVAKMRWDFDTGALVYTQ